MPETQRRRYLFTGGGTTGHVVPNLAMFGGLVAAEPESQFLYLGSAKGHESRHAPDAGIPFRAVASASFVSPRSPFRCARMLVRILWGVLQSLWVLWRFRPHVVIATGGYVAVPTTIAAWIARRPIYLHEQNVHPGLANRALAWIADRVGVSFPESLGVFGTKKAVLTGYPVRARIQTGDAAVARQDLGIAAHQRVALVCGGSLGARSINQGLVDALGSLLGDERISVVHVTGLNSSPQYHAYHDTCRRLERQGLSLQVPGRYVCRPYIEGIEHAYALADLVVARAGAGTVMELAALGKPSLLVPKSDAPGNHQMMNALSLENVGAANVLFEELTDEEGTVTPRVRGETLARRVRELLFRDAELRTMGERARTLARPDAIAANVAEIRRLAAGPAPRATQQKVEVTGYLAGSGSARHELIFRNTTLGSGLLSDIAVQGRGRAIVQRVRAGSTTEHHLVPRGGLVTVGGVAISKRRVLEAGDLVGIGASEFVFSSEERVLDVPVAPPEALGAKVVLTGIGTLASRLSGFVRAAVTAIVMGLGNASDILAVGLQAANFFRAVFAEVAVDIAFLPTYVQLLRSGRPASATRLFRSLLSLLLVGTTVATVAAMLTVDRWLPWLAPGFVARGIVDEAARITALMAPYLIFVSVAALLSAVLRAFDRFGTPAFSSMMFNVGILGGLAFYPAFGLSAVALGVVLGGVGQVLVQLPALRATDIRASGFTLRPGFHLQEPGVRKVAKLSPNVLLDASGQKLGTVVDAVLATSLQVGGVSALFFAMTLFRLPFGILSQSINTVVLKEISEIQASRDRDHLRRLLVGGLEWTGFLLLPVTAGLIVLAEPLVALLFQYGSFDASSTLLVARALQCYAVGLLGWGVASLCGRFFSARLEQGRSTLTSFLGLAVNIGLSVTFVRLGYGVGGLALGTSFAFLFLAALRLRWIVQSLRAEGVSITWSEVLGPMSRTAVAALASTLMMVIALAAVRGFDALPSMFSRAFVLLLPSGFGAAVFAAVALGLGSEPMDRLVSRIFRRRNPSATEVEATGRRVASNPLCLGAERLCAWLETHGSVQPDYNFAGRISMFLRSKSWKIVNSGVKLVGRLRLQEFQDVLIRKIIERTPVPWHVRVLGGDFTTPGFVRRNAVQALTELSTLNPEVERALFVALDDPYFEVRSGAAKALAALGPRLRGAAAEEAAVRVTRMTRDRNFEVARDGVRALGQLALDAETTLAALKALHYHRNWQVRDAVIGAYRRLYERGIVRDRDQMLAILDDVLITTEGFRPLFPLKQNVQRFRGHLGNEGTSAAGSPPPAEEREASA